MQLPTEFITKYQHLLGHEAPAFLASFNQPSQSGFRVNPLKPTPTATIKAAQGSVPYVPGGYYGDVDGKSLDHVTGAIYSQEPSAMYVGEVVNPQPGERVLDLCAAPGGKTTHLIAKMKDRGLVVANEIFRKRAQVLAENLERWGTRSTVVMNESPAKLEDQFPHFFDRILVDAPCSGEGMFRKEPAGIEYWNSDYPTECANRQKKILISALKMLKPGGVLVYSTCTFSPEEDEQNVAWLLKNYPALKMLPIKKYPGMDDGRPDWADGNPALRQAVRLFPHHIKGEGHFIAKLQNGETVMSNARPVARKKRRRKKKSLQHVHLNKQERAEFDQLRAWLAPQESVDHLVIFGDQLYNLPAGMPDLTGMTVLRPGLHLGVFKKKRFEPALAWALALDPQSCQHVLNLTLDQWRQYVHGDVININHPQVNGWYLLSCDGHTTGFGKLVGMTIKNFYPKGLRF